MASLSRGTPGTKKKRAAPIAMAKPGAVPREPPLPRVKWAATGAVPVGLTRIGSS